MQSARGKAIIGSDIGDMMVVVVGGRVQLVTPLLLGVCGYLSTLVLLFMLLIGPCMDLLAQEKRLRVL